MPVVRVSRAARSAIAAARAARAAVTGDRSASADPGVGVVCAGPFPPPPDDMTPV